MCAPLPLPRAAMLLGHAGLSSEPCTADAAKPPLLMLQTLSEQKHVS